MDSNTLDTTSLVSQGTVIAIMPTVSHQIQGIFVQMLPFIYVAIPLIILDLYYGRKKAQYDYENEITNIPCTIGKSVKMTLQKIFNYISWIFLSVTLSNAFLFPSFIYIIMGLIYAIEVFSLLNKYCEARGIYIDEVGMLKMVFKFIWSRLTGNFDETFDDIVKKSGKQKYNKRKKNKDSEQQ